MKAVDRDLVHNMLLVSVLSHTNRVYTLPSFFEFHFNIILPIYTSIISLATCRNNNSKFEYFFGMWCHVLLYLPTFRKTLFLCIRIRRNWSTLVRRYAVPSKQSLVLHLLPVLYPLDGDCAFRNVANGCWTTHHDSAVTAVWCSNEWTLCKSVWISVE